MAEVFGVQLVRCPQCENFLPEPLDFSAYQCGSCGAILRAEKQGLLSDGISELSNEVKNGVSGKGDGKAGLLSNLMPERESNSAEPGRTVERNLHENGELNINSSSATENKVIPANIDRGRRRTERTDSRFDENRITDAQHRHSSKGRLSDISLPTSSNYGMNFNRPAYVNSKYDSDFEEVRPLRSRPVITQRIVERNDVADSHVNGKGVAGLGGFGSFQYSDDRLPNYSRGAYYDYVDYVGYGNCSDGLPRVEILENDQADLLRKLDELADELSRCFDVADKPKETSFHDQQILAASACSYDVNKQPQAPDKHVTRPQRYTHCDGYVPYSDRHGSAIQESYPSRNYTHGYQGFADVYQPPMLRRPSHQLPHQEAFNQDLFMSHPHEAFFHQPACSCLHCLNKNWHVPPKLQPPSLAIQNSGNKYMNCISCEQFSPVAYGPVGYISEDSNLPQLPPRKRHPQTKRPSDLGIENGGFDHCRLKKVVVAQVDGKIFHPISGGAPFITCCNCYGLLKLPKKLMSMQKNQRKIKCDACSSMLLFELKRKGIVVSIPKETDQVFVDVAIPTSEMANENFQRSNDFPNDGAINCSDDYEHFNYDFQFTDVEPNLPLGKQMSNFVEPVVRKNPHSSSVMSSEDELSPDIAVLRKDVSHSVELPLKDEPCLPLPDSPFQEYSDHVSPDKLIHRNGQASKIKRTDQDSQEKKTSWQNSLNNALLETNTDVSYSDHSNSSVSHDSTEVFKVGDQQRIKKRGESFFVGLMRRTFGDFSRSCRSTESGKSNVFVNGNFIPDRVVKKAEKLAGPIQSGEYWYDFQAGFWGVMGHPCLGIILPNIAEFNHPMPEDCAGGNSRVFVNGRELHQKDLDLLTSRGLPNTRDKRYLIAISGRVVDEDTGEELDGLSKLAPTVERAKRGFGMKVPKSILQQRH